MDLGKFIQRQRQHTIAILSLLSGRQVSLVSKMSRLIINDDSHPAQFLNDNDHSEDFGDQATRENFANLLGIASGTSWVQWRLMSLIASPSLTQTPVKAKCRIIICSKLCS